MLYMNYYMKRLTKSFCNEFENKTYSNNNFEIKIEVKESNIHGNGVFATDNIKKGDFITIYPTDAYRLENATNNRGFTYRKDLEKVNDHDDFQENFDNYKDTHSYGIKYNNNKLKIFGNPYNYQNLKYVGHIVNDGVGDLFRDLTANNINNDVELKNAVVRTIDSLDAKCNSKFETVDGKTFVQSTRDIKKGEEILTFYEFDYWYNLRTGVNFPQRIIDFTKKVAIKINNNNH